MANVPLFDERPPGLTCHRLSGKSECGAAAAWHLIVDGDLNNVLCCDPHAAEFRKKKWLVVMQHEAKWPCTQPGTVLRYETVEGVQRSWCALDDGTALGRALSRLEAENPAVRQAAEEYEMVRQTLSGDSAP